MMLCLYAVYYIIRVLPRVTPHYGQLPWGRFIEGVDGMTSGRGGGVVKCHVVVDEGSGRGGGGGGGGLKKSKWTSWLKKWLTIMKMSMLDGEPSIGNDKSIWWGGVLLKQLFYIYSTPRAHQIFCPEDGFLRCGEGGQSPKTCTSDWDPLLSRDMYKWLRPSTL